MCMTHTYYRGMMTQAKATFDVSSWEEASYSELDGGTKLTRATWAQSWHGDAEGEEKVGCLMYYGPDGTVFTESLSTFVGTLGGRSGSFVLRGTGGYGDGVATATLTVVPGSGTGELAGLTGAAASAAGHDMTGTIEFEYDLG
jgi:Protein of unknown function (DUF3224)